jgi:hypothetical protein
LHETRRHELIESGFDEAAANRISFHEVREGEVRVAWRVNGKKYLNPRRAAQIGNDLGVKVERCVKYVFCERTRKLERRNRKKARQMEEQS